MATIHDKLTTICNAIRAKTGKPGLLTFDAMVTEINSINGSGANLTIASESGSLVSVSNGDKLYQQMVGSSGSVFFEGLDDGVWTITGVSGDITTTKTIDINTSYSAQLTYAKARRYIIKDGQWVEPFNGQATTDDLYGEDPFSSIEYGNGYIKFVNNKPSNWANYPRSFRGSATADLSQYNKTLYCEYSENTMDFTGISVDGTSTGSGPIYIDPSETSDRKIASASIRYPDRLSNAFLYIRADTVISQASIKIHNIWVEN